MNRLICVCRHLIDEHDADGCQGLTLATDPPFPVGCPCREFERRPRVTSRIDEAIDDPASWEEEPS